MTALVLDAAAGANQILGVLRRLRARKRDALIRAGDAA
ncbi:hypothetical protein CHAN_10380 [Corynebacterium hansenii]|nr:hypothetical protein CHAN_10380 [Corynebacterium hansenii]